MLVLELVDGLGVERPLLVGIGSLARDLLEVVHDVVVLGRTVGPHVAVGPLVTDPRQPERGAVLVVELLEIAGPVAREHRLDPADVILDGERLGRGLAVHPGDLVAVLDPEPRLLAGIPGAQVAGDLGLGVIGLEVLPAVLDPGAVGLVAVRVLGAPRRGERFYQALARRRLGGELDEALHGGSQRVDQLTAERVELVERGPGLGGRPERDEAVGEALGVALVAVAGLRDAGRGRRGAAVGLGDVRDLVRDQANAGLAAGVVGAGREVDILAEGERARVDRGRGARRAVVGVDPDARHVDAELARQARRQLRRQRCAAAAPVEERERRGQRPLADIVAGLGAPVDAGRLRPRQHLRGMHVAPERAPGELPREAVERPAVVGVAADIGRAELAGRGPARRQAQLVVLGLAQHAGPRHLPRFHLIQCAPLLRWTVQR